MGSDGTIYIFLNKLHEGNYLHAFNPDGSVKWIARETLPVITDNFAIGIDGTIYFGGDRGLFAINPEDGSIKWQTSYMGSAYHPTGPVIDSNGTIYIDSKDHHLYAVNPDGTIKWKFKTDRWVYSTPTIASGGTIYFSSLDEKLYAVSQGGGTSQIIL